MASVDSLQVALKVLDSTVRQLDGGSATSTAARGAFLAARLRFKRIEMAAAYYEPTTTELMNGPALPRVDDEEGPETVFPPEGFQVVEELLFPELDPAAKAGLLGETGNLIELATRLRNAVAVQSITDNRVWDAARLEIARVVTLGITGFDSPLAGHSFPEAAAALLGVREALLPFAIDIDGAGASWHTIDSTFAGAVSALQRADDFTRFNRLAFIVSHANPLARSVDAARARLGLALPTESRAFSMQAATLFDSGAFDSQAFRSPGTDRDTPARATLGRRLFFDPRLSGDGQRSCASCHDPARAFTDGMARSVSLVRGVSLRNAPTIVNAGLQAGSFYDLRTTFLEDQITDVMVNQNEMHATIDDAASLLSGDATYASSFAGAFGGSTLKPVTGTRLRSAIAAYIRGLNGLHSPVDRALRGDTSALTMVQRSGLNVFMGKGKCATCHFAPLFNGTVPPMYQKAEVEVLGVPARAVLRNARIDPDSGRFRITRATPHLHAFRTPTIRNVDLTAPYMHNGVFKTLDQVVEFYDMGGGAGIGISLEHQTLPRARLRLTAAERRALIEFMRALTDTAGLTARR